MGLASRAWRRVGGAVWWIRHRTTDRYDKVRIRGLEPGYHDKDTLMLYACFTLLQDYVEDECGGIEELREWTASLEKSELSNGGWQWEKQKECEALYEWWMKERPLRKDPTDLWVGGGQTREALDASAAEEERQHAEDEDMLHRLIRIRRGLWT